MKKLIVPNLYVLLFSFVLSACANTEDGHDSKLALLKTTDPSPVELMNNPETDSIGHAVKRHIAEKEELYDVAVIEGKEDILVTYKVKHLERFHMKKIEKDMEKQLEEKYPDENFVLSSDYKIFLETVRLREKMDRGTISKKKAEKEFQDILKLHKEKT